MVDGTVELPVAQVSRSAFKLFRHPSDGHDWHFLIGCVNDGDRDRKGGESENSKGFSYLVCTVGTKSDRAVPGTSTVPVTLVKYGTFRKVHSSIDTVGLRAGHHPLSATSTSYLTCSRYQHSRTRNEAPTTWSIWAAS